MSEDSANRCPYCLAAMDQPEADPIVRCGKCLTQHHLACFREHGRCTLLGCGCAEVADPDAVPPQPGSLHPFLPRAGKQLLKRQASFLSVVRSRVRRKKGTRLRRELFLQVPNLAVLGSSLKATLVATSEQTIQGAGLRFVLHSYLQLGADAVLLSHQEAVVAGRARKDWLSRVKLWSREPPARLLLPGTSTFELSFDPSPVAWRGALPEGSEQGPIQYLEVFVELDAKRPVRTETHRLRLVDGRPAPPSLDAAKRPDLARPAEVVPLSNPVGGAETWEARPIIAQPMARKTLWPVATLAVRHSQESAAVPTVEAIDLEAVVLSKGPVARGSLRLDVRRSKFAGRLVIEFSTQRRSLKQGVRAWRTYAREAAVLCEGSHFESDVSGEHTFAFEYVLPPCSRWGKKDDPRRLLVEAAVLGEGKPLRAQQIEVAL